MQTKMPVATNPYLLLSITAIIWGGNAIAGKMAAGHISPFLLTSLRWFFACIILFAFSINHLKRDYETISKNWKFMFLLGAFGFAIFNCLMYLALNYTSAINVAIEQASMPLIVFALNYIIFKTRVTGYQVLGFIITLIGVAVTVTRGNLFGLGDQSLNIGDLIMLCAIMVYGVYSVALKNKPQIHTMSFLSVLGFAAFLTTIPLVLLEAANDSFLWPDEIGWGVVFYAAIFPSIISQLFWIMGLEQIGSNRGGIFINLVPISGAILAVLILGETFQSYHAVGLALVLGGIAFAQKQSAQ
jgi:drug/metabolite transporter (DMT)-like permease